MRGRGGGGSRRACGRVKRDARRGGALPAACNNNFPNRAEAGNQWLGVNFRAAVCK